MVFADLHVPVDEWNQPIAIEVDTLVRQLDAQSQVIRPFEQSGPKGLVNFNGTANHFLADENVVIHAAGCAEPMPRR
jgi:hypothetical protein